ncbi:DUF962 domain-containing protein [Ramlibacter solisilvae]|uniref:Terminase n=1 Tax=Ramlibacter tataouinensis TaxID=94132 RepID=A0A127K1J2_9BURK|nr:hypothetical protein [Ramlibacter tataouinensis]AMO25032.1 terminase [Ramlibacter tataouinensis]
MSFSQLLRWQWEGYPRYHRSRFNLLLHIFVVPLFLAGNVALVAGLFLAAWPSVAAGALAMGASVALQGRGHRQERMPSEPFTSPLNAVGRIFVEQWVNFPRFVLSGGWLQAWREAGAA